MDIRGFKLITGEEVIAGIIEEVRASTNTSSTDGLFDSSGPIVAYNIRKPHILRVQPVGPGQLGLAFVPWMLSNPDVSSVNLPVSSIITEPFEISDQVEKQYLQQTSGIELIQH